MGGRVSQEAGHDQGREDHRRPSQDIPLQKNLQVQVRENGEWKTAGEIKEATTKDLTIAFAQPVATDALRVFVRQ